MSTPLLIARTLEKELFLLPAMANRHARAHMSLPCANTGMARLSRPPPMTHLDVPPL